MLRPRGCSIPADDSTTGVVRRQGPLSLVGIVGGANRRSLVGSEYERTH
jgi:hypothetical protein